MTRDTLIIAALCATTALTTAALADPGYMTTMIDVPHRDRDVELHIWYPTDENGASDSIGRNAVFKGTSIQRDATPADGSYPLVLLSHGSGGNAANLGWIAGALAERGMIVAAPNHPGTTSRDSLQTETVKIWERPADLSAIIDHMLDTGAEGPRVDADHIAALGFSLGGYTVLGIGGALVNKAAYLDYCDAHAGMMDCGWLTADGLDLASIDQTRYEQSNHDPRITAVVSVDPALSAAFTPDSLGAMNVPVQLINMGEGADVPAAIDAANLVEFFPQAELEQIAEATHFSFLGDCKRMGAVIIMAAGEDPICSEVGSRKRAAIHTELKKSIGDFLSRSFAPSS